MQHLIYYIPMPGFLQLNLLLQFSVSNNNFTSYIFRGFHQKQTDILREAFSWVTILWQLGFQHDNPQGTLSFIGLTM